MPRRSHADEVARFTQPDRDTLAFAGALTFATAARAYASASAVLTSGSQTRLDLGGVTRADSAGLACVLALAAQASRAGRRLAVVGLPDGLRALAAVCGVQDLLGVDGAAA